MGHMGQFRVVTWNIRKAIGLDRRRDPARVLSVIADMNADIVALQEADRRLGNRPSALPREVVQEATGLVPVDPDNGPSLGWHGNALLVSPAFTVEAVHRMDLPGLEPRGALAADLHCGETKLRIAATHLGLVRRFRLRQISSLLDTLDAQDSRPTLIAGDFNEWSRTTGLELLEERFEVHAPGHSYHASRPMAHLDRIAICRNLRLCDAGVIDAGTARNASDHLPVWAEIEPTIA